MYISEKWKALSVAVQLWDCLSVTCMHINYCICLKIIHFMFYFYVDITA